MCPPVPVAVIAHVVSYGRSDSESNNMNVTATLGRHGSVTAVTHCLSAAIPITTGVPPIDRAAAHIR